MTAIKTNKIAQREEQLTYVRHPSKQLFEKIYKNYKKCQGNPKSGKIFPQAWTTTRNLNYQLGKVCKKFKINPKLTCHSGRSWAAQTLSIRKADLVTINTFMR